MPDTVLEYVGLNINRISSSIKAKKPNYNSAKSFDNSALYKVYKKIPVESIDILVSDTDRTTDIKERFQTSVTIDTYIKENKEKITALAESTTIKKIQELEKFQEELTNQMPYFVKFDKNYLWQIYYSKEDDRYFMLYPAKEGETEALFYLIKQKLSKENKEIYVPICQESCSEEILSESKLHDIENYIWIFTGVWPQIYESTFNNEKGIYITGQIKVERDFTTRYRVELKDSEQADKYYTLLKALFIITTETKNIYEFTPQINSKGELILLYDNKQVESNNIKNFITTETAKQQNLKYEYKRMATESENKLEKIKEIIDKQIEVYSNQEKQIATFMSCKKSFFKKMRFFFTNNKKFSLNNRMILAKIQEEVEKTERMDEKEKITETDVSDIPFNMFTISDLISTAAETKKISDRLKSLKADIKALQLKERNMERKIANAQVYLDEIEKHKKSLLEFWKYTNKDNENALNEGRVEEQEEKKQASFNIQEDLNNFAIETDEIQRKKLSKDECDALFIAKYLLPGINSVITRSDTYMLDEEYDELKKDFQNNDSIFGNITDDYRKLKTLNNKKHRESRKNVYSVLRFNEFTSLDDFKERMRELGNLVNEAYQKLTAKYEMTLYYSKRNKGYIIGDINPYKLIKDEDVKKIYKMQTKNDTHVVFFTNSAFYDNNNKTLPLGMDESTEFITKVGENKKISDVDINLLIEKDLYNVEVKKIKIIEEGKRN